MAAAKFKWRVDEAPTGPYRSFQARGWPSAVYKNVRQDLAGDIQCGDDYTPARAKGGRHAPLQVRVCDHSVHPFKWRSLVGQHVDLATAKAVLASFIAENPQVLPADLRDPSATPTK